MKLSDKIIYALSTLILIIFIAFTFVFCFSYLSCFSCAKNTPVCAGEILSVYIYGRSEDSISARITVNSFDGSELFTVERSWHSKNLYVSFIRLDFSEKKFIFPSKVYIKQSNTFHKGISFSKFLFEKNMFLLSPPNFIPKEASSFYNLARFAYRPSSSVFSKNVGTEVFDLTVLESGVEYNFFWSGESLSLQKN